LKIPRPDQYVNGTGTVRCQDWPQCLTAFSPAWYYPAVKKPSVAYMSSFNVLHRTTGARRRLFLALHNRVRQFFIQRFTVMVIPHTDRKPIHLQVNLALASFLALFAAFVLIGFIIFSTLYSGSAQQNVENTFKLEQSRENLDAVLDEVKELSKVYQVFQGTMGTTLSELSIQSGRKESAVGSSGDLARVSDMQEITSDEIREIVELKRLSASLSSAVLPLSEIAEVLKAQKQLLSDIPNLWPVAGGQSFVTMEFGPNIHPFTNKWYIHKGIDIAGPLGLPLVAAANGKIVEAAYDSASGYGLTVVIEHKYGFRTKYTHMNNIYVQPGQEVYQGQRIGSLGNTGLSTGAHVHFELMIGTQVLDPASFLKIKTDFARWEGNR